jgi:hypothetical protein
MKPTQIFVFSAVLSGMIAFAAPTKNVARDVDFKTANGTILKGTYFAAAKPGPGVLLFHQSNRTRKSWEDVARQLAAAGINVLTVDADPSKTRKQRWPGELDAAFEFLVSQPGVNRDVVGIGGAGVIGVEDSVETARLHSAEVKSLVLLSGETESLDFLRQASQLPELFVVADNDEYPPIVERWNCSTSPLQAQAGNSCTTLRRSKRPGFGTSRSISEKCRRPAVTEQTCSKPIPNCPASSWIGL